MPEVLSRLIVPVEPAANYDVIRKQDLADVLVAMDLLSFEVEDGILYYTKNRALDVLGAWEFELDNGVLYVNLSEDSKNPFEIDSETLYYETGRQ